MSQNRTNPKNAMPGGGEMYPPHKFLNSAGLFIRFVPAYLCLELHYVATPFFILCDCHLPHVFYLSDEACTHRVHVDGHLFTELLYPGRCKFFNLGRCKTSSVGQSAGLIPLCHSNGIITVSFCSQRLQVMRASTISRTLWPLMSTSCV